MKRRALALVILSTTSAPAVAQEELFRMTPSDGALSFGFSVAVSGDRAIVGAPDAFGYGYAPGAAYVFDASTGEELSRLEASDGAISDQFGWSVSLSGDLAVVGAPGLGSAYVFDVVQGVERHRLAPDGGRQGQFGTSVAVSGDHAVVGSPYSDAAGPDSGSVHVVDLADGRLLFELTASDAAPGDTFGWSVAISGDRAAVGAYEDDDNGTSSGSVYVFDVKTGHEILKVVPANSSPGDNFGYGVALSGDSMAVVAPSFPNNSSAYVFDVASGQELFELTVDGVPSAAALSGHLLIVGQWYWNGMTEPYPIWTSADVFDLRTGQRVHELWQARSGNLLGQVAVAVSGNRALVSEPYIQDEGLPGEGLATAFSTPQAQGSSFCFGVGRELTCPCANSGRPGEGCANSTGDGGRLDAAGSTSASADELVLYGTNLLPSQPALLFAGVESIEDGEGAPFGDGLRCAGVAAVRFDVQLPNMNGDTVWGPNLGQVGGWTAGDTRYLQAWYRDPSGPCGSGFNLTNGIEVAFQP